MINDPYGYGEIEDLGDDLVTNDMIDMRYMRYDRRCDLINMLADIGIIQPDVHVELQTYIDNLTDNSEVAY